MYYIQSFSASIQQYEISVFIINTKLNNLENTSAEEVQLG